MENSGQASNDAAAGIGSARQGSSGGYMVHETKPIGNEFRHEQTWPSIASLQGRQDIDNMRIKTISFSKWASNDTDLSGIKVTNNQGQTSELMAKERYEFVSVILQ